MSHVEALEYCKQRYETKPDNLDCVTLVTCTHPIFGLKQLWFRVEDYQDHFIRITAPYWINGYTIIIQDANTVF